MSTAYLIHLANYSDGVLYALTFVLLLTLTIMIDRFWSAKCIVFDAKNRKVLASLPIGYGSDSAGFDPKTGLAFSSNRDGTLSTIGERSANDFVDLGSIRTEPGARTMAVDPATGRIFTMTETASPVPSQQPGRAPEIRYQPGTLHMLFYDPQSDG